MATPTTVNTWPLNGSIQEFDVTFDYLSQTFIKVNLVGPTGLTPMVLGTDYTFVTPTRIRTTVPYGPPTFTTIELRRETSTTERLVEFQDASILHAQDLNVDALQVMHVAEEARNAATETLGVNGDGNLDARNRRIVNVLDPIDPADVVTLNYYTSQVTGVRADRLAAEAARDKAQEWAIKPTAVEGMDQSAKTYAGQAGTSASTASTAAGTATTQAGLAATARTGAETARTGAETARTGAETARDVTLGYRDTAQGAASTATTQAGIATTQAGIATTKAAEAAASAQSVDSSYLNGQLANNTVAKSVHGGQLAGTRNAIINGAMLISHEGNQPGSIGGAYAIDMWGSAVNPPATHVVNASRIDLNNDAVMRPLGFFDAHRQTRATTAAIGATDYIILQYPMEGNDMRRFIGNTFTLSFWTRASKAGPLFVALRSGKANRSYYRTVNITTANVWQKVSLTISGGLPTEWINNTAVTGWRDELGLQICFVAATGTSFRTGIDGTWYTGNFLGPAAGGNLLTTNGDFWDLTGVQMELGSVATAFEHSRYEETLKRLNRYVYLFEGGAIWYQQGTPFRDSTAPVFQLPVRMPYAPVVTYSVTAQSGGITLASTAMFSSVRTSPATTLTSGQYAVFDAFAKAYPK